MNILKRAILITTIAAVVIPVLAVQAQTDEDKIQSIKAVYDSILEINKETDRLGSQIEAAVKKAIDDVVVEVRETADVPAYQIRNIIDDPEDEAFAAVRNVISSSSITDTDIVDRLEQNVEALVLEIKELAESEFNVEVSVSANLDNIRQTLDNYREQVEINRQTIIDQGGDLIDRDSDEDGLSDYDETYIYNTDPNNAYTSGGTRNDSEKIIAGINPTSETEEEIQFADPRIDQEAIITDLYTVERIDLVEDEITASKNLYFAGRALPNSLVSLYVFSTPIVVTVKTDSRGEWEYVFDQELEDGNHEVYVATVNNSGKLIARSNAIPFTKTAEAAAFGSVQINDNSEVETFVERNLELLVLTILLAAILITLMLTGQRSKTQKLIDAANKKTEKEGKEGVTSVEVEGQESERV